MKPKTSLVRLSSALATACAILTASTLVAQPATFPKVIQAGLVSPTILGITFEDGTLVRAGQEPYVAEPGDEIRVPTEKYVPSNTPQLWRNGAFTGWLVENRTVLTRPEKIVNPFPDTDWLDRADAFRIESPDDPRFAKPGHPAKLSRKSLPHATVGSAAAPPPSANPDKRSVVRHTIYLHLDEPWKKDARYRVSFDADVSPLDLTINDALRSEAIHATQLGFTPEDQPKVAFLSCWLGTGGALTQPENPPFHVVDTATGEIVHRGTGVVTKRAADNESKPESPRNLSLTDVVMFDFSPVTARGEYRVVVPDVGSSAPIRIADGVWLDAFTHLMKYFYVQRSGVEIRPPYAEFRRPRNLHPADGVKITESTLTLMESTNGLKALGPGKGSFDALAAGDTGKVVGPEFWGGYADSGDWDRRIQHLQAARLQLDLLLEGGDLFPALKLNIPESGNGLPDVLNVALWDLDFYRRIMTPEGGVRGGIESAEHPKAGEGSWQESFSIFAYSPDPWSSYLFAATAARCAFYAEGKYPEVAQTYRDAALKAMTWAEAELPRFSDDQKFTPGALGAVQEARNLAAADLYRLTGDQRWLDLFAKTFQARSAESLWAFLQTKRDRDPALVEKSSTALLEIADRTLADQNQLGYRFTRPNVGAENGYWGLFAKAPNSDVLLRAYELTGEAKYRSGAILAAQMALGANPNNVTYISGLGYNPMRNVFHLDTKVQGLEAPAGLLAFGPHNPTSTNTTFNSQIRRTAGRFVPEPATWPMTEFCVDTGQLNPVDEHVPDLTGWVAYTYGSLARGPKPTP